MYVSNLVLWANTSNITVLLEVNLIFWNFTLSARFRGIHRWPVNSPHKRPVTRKMFPSDDVIMKFQKPMTHFMATYGSRFCCLLPSYISMHVEMENPIVSYRKLCLSQLEELLNNEGKQQLDDTWGSYWTEWDHCNVVKTSETNTRAPSQYKDRLIYVWQFPC